MEKIVDSVTKRLVNTLGSGKRRCTLPPSMYSIKMKLSLPKLMRICWSWKQVTNQMNNVIDERENSLQWLVDAPSMWIMDPTCLLFVPSVMLCCRIENYGDTFRISLFIVRIKNNQKQYLRDLVQSTSKESTKKPLKSEIILLNKGEKNRMKGSILGSDDEVASAVILA